MFFSCRKHQKALLKQRNIILFSVFKVIQLILPDNINFGPGGSFPIVYSASDMFDVLNDKIH